MGYDLIMPEAGNQQASYQCGLFADIVIYCLFMVLSLPSHVRSDATELPAMEILFPVLLPAHMVVMRERVLNRRSPAIPGNLAAL